MSHHGHDHNSHTEGSSHLLLGMIIGGGLALLLATDRGRELLKEFSEAGLEAFENLEKKTKEVTVEPIQVYDEETEDEDSEDLAASAPLPTATQIEQELEKVENNPRHPATQTRVQRFFKGVKKKKS